MIIVMSPHATAAEIKAVETKIAELGYKPHEIEGVERKVIGAVGDERGKDRLQSLESMAGVESVLPILKPYKLASREVQAKDTIVYAGGVPIGGKPIAIMAGPCSVESHDQLLTTAHLVKKAGANFLREKIKILNENLEEIREMAQDALEDGILMGCDEAQLREVLMALVDSLENPYGDRKGAKKAKES